MDNKEDKKKQKMHSKLPRALQCHHHFLLVRALLLPPASGACSTTMHIIIKPWARAVSLQSGGVITFGEALDDDDEVPPNSVRSLVRVSGFWCRYRSVPLAGVVLMNNTSLDDDFFRLRCARVCLAKG